MSDAEIVKTPEQDRFERVVAKIATLKEEDQRMVQAGIAMLEMAIAEIEDNAAVLAVAYVSCRIAAGLEASLPEEPRIVVPGRIIN